MHVRSTKLTRSHDFSRGLQDNKRLKSQLQTIGHQYNGILDLFTFPASSENKYSMAETISAGVVPSRSVQIWKEQLRLSREPPVR